MPDAPDAPDQTPQRRKTPKPRPEAPILVLDTASPVVSLAVGDADAILAQETLALRRSSETLLATVDEVLGRAGLQLAELRGVAAVRGPGSFTGLRVGLSTAIGWHQALGLPVAGLDAHEILALAAARRWGRESRGREITAVVDALRGEWSARVFRIDENGRPQSLGERRLVRTGELIDEGRATIGFGVEALIQAADEASPAPEIIAAPPLAPVALAASAGFEWDPGLLVQPIYFRAPAVSVSKKDPTPAPLD